MNAPVTAVGRFHERNLRYFTQFHDRAALANLRQLRAALAAFALFLCSYGLITYFMFRYAPLTRWYFIFGGLCLCFVPFAFLYGRRKPPSFRVVQAACLLFMLMVMAFTIAISIFPYPDDPGIFYPLAYMLVIVLFILPYRYTAVLLTGATAAYLLLLVWYKDPIAVRYDAFAGITTWALGFFFLYVITDLRLRDGERLEELERLSRTDALTGLPNRRAMEESMTLGYRRCQRTGMWAAVVMADVDDFKDYNDRLGHPAGDECLRALSRVFLDFADEQGVYASRYGGEEFLFFLPDCDEENAQWASAGLLSRVRDLALPFPGHGIVSVSVGMAAVLPGPAGSPSTLVQRADEALYNSKSAGKDRMELWHEAN